MSRTRVPVDTFRYNLQRPSTVVKIDPTFEKDFTRFGSDLQGSR
ncbi:hypothetical protein MICRO8M_20205 [Microbacterium sp. 8M]|nr:hypothetical protein MICRO8M_20205 [Microbacterium sp. 8M]